MDKRYQGVIRRRKSMKDKQNNWHPLCYTVRIYVLQSENPNNQWQQRIASTTTDVDYSCSFTLLFSVSGLSHYMPFYPHIIFVRHSAEHLYMFFPRDKKIFANESKIGNISSNLTTISCWESCMAELIIFLAFFTSR